MRTLFAVVPSIAEIYVDSNNISFKNMTSYMLKDNENYTFVFTVDFPKTPRKKKFCLIAFYVTTYFLL